MYTPEGKEGNTMKISEMNAHQRAIYRMMDELTIDIIGGRENDLQDYPEDSEEYQAAKAFLTMGHDAMKELFYCMLTSQREMQRELRFAGNAFLLERIERRLRKWGY